MGSTTPITVHKLCDKPTKAWSELKVKQKVQRINPLDPSTPITDDKIRFVCISDTHSILEKTKDYILPKGDVLLHAGDFTNIGRPVEVDGFNHYLGKLPYKVKVVIAGNHDLTLDDQLVKEDRDKLLHCFRLTKNVFEDKLKELGVSCSKELLTNCIYLEDESVNICGIHIYGTPWQPEFGGWGFNLKRGQECLDKWNKIPNDTDILISHGPPLGYGDTCFGGNNAGCTELLTTIQQRVQPKYHICGHIHEGYGVRSDGKTIFINASTCTIKYKPSNPPIVFDIPIPDGHTKSELDTL